MNAVIGALRVNLGIDTAQFNKGLSQTQAGLARFSAAAKVGLAAAASGVAVGAVAIGRAIGGVIDNADKMDEIAQKIGVPTEELSRLKYAAETSGTSFETLQGGLARLSRGMADGSQSFANLGVQVRDANGDMRPTSDVLSDIAEKFAAMPDGAQKTAESIRLFGRSLGPDLVPLLNQGRDGIAALKDEASTFTTVITKEMGENAGIFSENMQKLQGALGSIAGKLAEKLLPSLTAFSNWAVQNAPAIVQWATDMGSLVSNEITNTINTFTDLRDRIASIPEKLSAMWTAFSKGWDKVVQQVNGIKDQIVGAFAALPGQMVEIGGNIVAGLITGLKGKFAELKAYVQSWADALPQWMRDRLGINSPSRVMAEIGGNIADGLTRGLMAGSGSTKDSAVGIADQISSAFSGIGSSIAGLIDGTKSWKQVLKDVLGQLAQIALTSLGKQGGIGGFLASLLGGLAGFRRGGTILPGGSGGIDGQVVAFRKSPTEQVDIYDPRKASRGGSGGGGRMMVDVGVSVDNNGNLQAYVRNVSQQQAQAAGAQAVREVRGNLQTWNHQLGRDGVLA